MYYYLPWLSLMIASLAASLALLVWGFKSGQFSEQERARYLPLRDSDGPLSGKQSPRITKEVYVLIGLIGSASAILVATLVSALMRR